MECLQTFPTEYMRMSWYHVLLAVTHIVKRVASCVAVDFVPSIRFLIVERVSRAATLLTFYACIKTRSVLFNEVSDYVVQFFECGLACVRLSGRSAFLVSVSIISSAVGAYFYLHYAVTCQLPTVH